MSGRWLLDAAALLGASRRVASKHIALRNHQFDKHSKTSSLVKAIKYQTERVSLTLKAATVIAERVNKTGSRYSSPPHEQQTSTAAKPVPSNNKVEGHWEVSPKTGPFKQDHHYIRPERSEIPPPVADSSLNIHQGKASESPLPDGTVSPRKSRLVSPVKEQKFTPEAQRSDSNQGNTTTTSPARGKSLSTTKTRVLQRQSEAQIPSQAAETPPVEYSEAEVGPSRQSELDVGQEKDVYYTRPSGSSPGLSSLPRVKVPKVTENTQESDEHFLDAGMNQDVYYFSKASGKGDSVPKSQAPPEQGSAPEGMYSEIFHSPRVATLLIGGQRDSRTPYAMNRRRPGSVPNMDHQAAEKTDTDTSSSQTKTQESVQSAYPDPASAPKPPAGESDADVSQSAADIAQGVQTGKTAEARVGASSISSIMWY